MPFETANPAAPGCSAPMRQALIERGFVPHGRRHAAEGCTYSTRGRWCILQERQFAVDRQVEASAGLETLRADSKQADPWATLSRGMGEHGLWKWLKGNSRYRVFEIPTWVISHDPEDAVDETGPAPFGALLDWAVASRTHPLSPMSTVEPPQSATIQSWFPRSALTVQVRGIVRQGEFRIGEDRCALRFPILTDIPRDLAPSRLRALQQLVTQAQRHWAMARIGAIPHGEQRALIAEVDFTGAPACQLLFLAGLEVLRNVIAWLVETAEVLTDPSLELASLAPDGTTPKQPTIRTTV